MSKLLIHKIGPGEIISLGFLYIYLLFKFLPSILAFSFVIGTFAALFYYLNDFNNYWTKKGIPGPKGNILYGHVFKLFKAMHLFDKENEKKYGKTFGLILNGTPDFVTSDLELLKEILIKNFDAFPDRHDILEKASDKIRGNFLTVKQGDDWRRIRHRITPAFTTGKMKKLLPTMNYCSKELIKYLNKFAETEQPVPLKEILSKLTMNAIGRAAFAVELNSFDDTKQSAFLYYAQKLFALKLTDPIIIFSVLFPNLANLYIKITGKAILQNDVFEYFTNSLNQIMEQRLKDPDASHKYNDAFQLLLNALDDNEKPQITSEDADILSETVSKIGNKTLSKCEILSQLVIFLAAGYETTATTLQFVCYNLAYKQDIQDRLRNEVMNVLNGRDSIDYEDMSKLNYLNQVIMETLRMYPPAVRINRLCQKDVVIDGFEFEKETTVSFNVFNIHHDPENYPNPYDFNPDRFTPENKEMRHPLSFLGFGAGPRICLGMRFAEFEMRITLVDLIKNFKFLPAEGMPGIPVEVDTTGLLKSKVELKCKIQKI